MDRIGKYIKRIPSPDINRTTVFTKFNYAIQNYYSDDINYIPNPIETSDYNCYITFYTREPGNVVVDWGDGNVETFKLMKVNSDSYIAAWRSLNIDYRKNPAAIGGGWGLGVDQDTGQYIRPYPNHHYADNIIDKDRHFTLTFDVAVYSASFNTTIHNAFPILEMPSLESLNMQDNKNIREIPYNRISKLKKLKSLTLGRLGGVLQYIPDSMFELTELTNLNFSVLFNLSNIDSSNIRKISKLKKLKGLDLSASWLPQYIIEFNDLNELVNLNINTNVLPDSQPRFDEVTQINQNLKNLSYMGSGWLNGRSRTNWADWISGKGIGNITNFDASYNSTLVLTFPDYIKNEMRSLSSFYMINSMPTQDRADTFVNNLYDYITGWTQITMSSLAKDGKRNQFYGLDININSVSEPSNNTRPSGIERAPAGFVKGVSNGTPTTPMERIYVLKNNYNQSWNVKP